MEFNKIIKELSKKYQILPKASNFAEIVTSKAFNALNYYFLAIKQELGCVFITDCANTLQCLNLNPEQVNNILNSHLTIYLDDETIIMPYKNENSVAEFIQILDRIANYANKQ